MAADYNKTLNLPQTDFPMRANLPQREPEMLAKWEKERTYYGLNEQNKGKPSFILHDGPPYANGDIHCGTAMNKVLKDFIVKYKNMTGYYAPFVPGWDTHGLPIELKALKALNVSENTLTKTQIRECCREFALSFLDNQKAQFKRLGVWADYDNPYITLAKEFEAKQIEIFGEMALKGYIYQGLKPVYWCSDCKTALAEAEIEYADDKCTSIYVKFPVKEDFGKLKAMGATEKTYFVIWTTTTWTLPANVAVCVGPNFTYCLVRSGDECYVIARELVENVMKAANVAEYEILGEISGAELELMTTRHPFLDRESLVIVGDHVTLESGTGCVHTAPGHGMEDYVVCRKYPQLPILVPVDDRGYMTEEAGRSAGLKTVAANKVILEELIEKGLLLASEEIVHQYPHCWRCHKPVLFRATKQWFCSVDAFKDEAIDAVKDVKFFPPWGHDRLTSMVADRADWCISRQRTWGVPIPMFICSKCGKVHVSRKTIDAVAELFRTKGSDSWYSLSVEEILGEKLTCDACGSTEFEKETDIMDVWFDSGCTHAAVLETRDDLSAPADLYLEGADQFRGWFQSSLLTSVAARGRAPFRQIVVHGWIVDGEGRAMHKSLGNAVAPDEIIKDYGADVLRLWVAASDYQNDVRVSKDIVKQLSEAYRKIRNTARFILGNLSDFNPETDCTDALSDLDRWAMSRLDDLIVKARDGYENYQFHTVYRALYDFCVVDMSNIYLDIIKDRLYTEKPTDPKRRAAQTVIWKVLDAITRIMAPIVAFTADEIWAAMPHKADESPVSPVYNDFPTVSGLGLDDAKIAEWNELFALRDDIKKALELARAEKVIGASLEAQITVYCDDAAYAKFAGKEELFKEICIVSGAAIVNEKGGDHTGAYAGVGVSVKPAEGTKCSRCWCYSTSVGQDAEHPELCARCAAIVK